MADFLPTTLVTILGAALALLVAARFPPNESRWVLASYGAHVLSVFAQIAMTRIGGGDMFFYAAQGEVIAAAMRVDFGQFGPEVLKLFFRQEPIFPFDVVGAGSSTGTMQALAGLLIFVTGGSIYTMGMIVGTAAYFGQVAMYRAFRNACPSDMHRRVLFATLLVPSAVFWSSGFVKEAVAVSGLGPLVWGLERLSRRLDAGALLVIIVGATVVLLAKAYVLIAVAVAAGVWMYFSIRGSRGGFRPSYLLVGTAIALGGLTLVSRLFPEYSPENFAEQAAYHQEVGQTMEAGSNYSLGESAPTTLAGQLGYLPLGVATALYRPLIIEAKNPLIFVNSLETTALLILTLRVLARSKLSGALSTIFRTPMLAFCAAFVIVLAVGVGLSTTNLGTLSRYRMPLVPFLWAVLLVLDSSDRLRPSTVVPETIRATRVARPFPAGRRELPASTAADTGQLSPRTGRRSV